MHLKVRNVNCAFYELVKGIHSGNVPTAKVNSRNGPVLQVEEVVTITYAHPKERVLFNSARDANPFFHMYEALWMISGRNDLLPLQYYLPRFKDYSDDGVTLNGAYGYRWRNAGPIPVGYKHEKWEDQLKILIDHLKRKPDSRRAVLAMWNVEQDLLNIEKSVDVCCNLECVFSIREVVEDIDSGGVTPWGAPISLGTEKYKVLDMTVFNRSNDLIWGMLGANAVHFSILLEYMAAHLGVKVGVYNQVTHNLHVYTNNWNPESWLEDEEYTIEVTGYTYGEAYPNLKSVPLVFSPEKFDQEVDHFVELNKGPEETSCKVSWSEPFLRDVAQPMCRAFSKWKNNKDGEAALAWCGRIEDEAWKIAATEWIQRRIERRSKSKKCDRSYHDGMEGEV